MAERLHQGERVFRGIPVSAGVCRGRVLLLDPPHHVPSLRTLSEAEVAGERYVAALAKVDDEYFRERAGDMRDVISRVLHHLTGQTDAVDLRQLKEPCIVIAHDLTPSRTAQLDRKMVLGFATDVGSKTS